MNVDTSRTPARPKQDETTSGHDSSTSATGETEYREREQGERTAALVVSRLTAAALLVGAVETAGAVGVGSAAGALSGGVGGVSGVSRARVGS